MGEDTTPQQPTLPDREAERRIRDAIRDAAPRHIDLLQAITSTEVALHEFQNNVARLEHLDKELKAQIKTTSEAATVTQARLTEYTKEKDSFGRRWAYILAHKRRVLEQKIKEGEQVYLAALATQSTAEQRERKLRQDKHAIEDQNSVLIIEAEKHGAAHEEIDELYHRIFDGPTPGFPDEDEHEQQYNDDKQHYEDAKAAVMAINASAKNVALVHATITRAQKESRMAKYELDSATFDGSEEALTYLDRCVRLIDQTLIASAKTDEGLAHPLEVKYNKTQHALARHLVLARTAAVAPLTSSASATSSHLGRTIQSITEALALAREAEMELMKIVKGYEADAKQVLKEASRTMEDSRQYLQEIRQNAFEVTVGHGAAAPSYQECCDRAAQFESAADEEIRRMPDPIIDDSGLPPPPSYEATVGTGNVGR